MVEKYQLLESYFLRPGFWTEVVHRMCIWFIYDLYLSLASKSSL